MKKLIAILLAVMMLLAVAAVMSGCGEQKPAGTDAPVAHTHDIGDQKDVTFTAWDGAAITADGTYNLYLENDLAATTQVVLGDLKEEKDITINLCLNGKKWSSDARVAALCDGVTLNICNCSETESTIIGKGDTFTTRGGTFTVNPLAELNVYKNINLTCDNSQNRVNYGGVVDLKGKMGIYGATITGCEVKRIAKDDGSADTSTGQGGAISVNAGAELYMQDGTIKDGKASTGGNVRIEAGGLFTMDDGLITNGFCPVLQFNGANSGGNGAGVFVEQATFIMKGGEISGNKVEGKAAVICNGPKCVVEMSGDAKIINNETTDKVFGGGIHFAKADGVLKLSGNVQITGNKNGSGASNVLIYAPGMIINSEAGLTANAKVGISVKDNAAVQVVDKDVAGVYTADAEGFELIVKDGGLELAEKAAAAAK